MTFIHKEIYGEGQPIVLIHGWAMHSGVWRKFAQQLALHYQVICLDLPGHGASEAVEPYCLDNVCQVLVKEMPESPVCILGWSLGATIALAITNRFPEKISSLIMLAGNPLFVEKNEWNGVKPDTLDDFATLLKANCQLTLIRFLALQVNGLPDGKNILKGLKRAIQECDPPSENILKGGLNILKKADLRNQFALIQCPVCLIQGDKDTLIPIQASQSMQEIKPDVNANIILGAGHIPFISHQSQVITIIDHFL